MSKKVHYDNHLGYETKPHYNYKAHKKHRNALFDIYKTLCKMIVGCMVVAPLNAPYGYAATIISCVAWVGYCVFSYLTPNEKTKYWIW